MQSFVRACTCGRCCNSGRLRALAKAIQAGPTGAPATALAAAAARRTAPSPPAPAPLQKHAPNGLGAGVGGGEAARCCTLRMANVAVLFDRAVSSEADLGTAVIPSGRRYRTRKVNGFRHRSTPYGGRLHAGPQHAAHRAVSNHKPGAGVSPLMRVALPVLCDL